VFVMRRLARRMPGGVFLISVPTQAIAVLSGRLSIAHHSDWLGAAAVAFFCLSLILYGVALVCFDFRQILTGVGDQWVSGGAVAIAALAASTLLASPQFTADAHRTLRVAALALLALTFAWYAVLFCAEIYRPRLAYDVRRWSTIFPLGMIAEATLSVSANAGIGWLEPLGRVLLWIAVGAWLLTFVAMFFTRGRAPGETGEAGGPRPEPSSGAGQRTRFRA
jgi:tellurite resistance protein TehA-like permease